MGKKDESVKWLQDFYPWQRKSGKVGLSFSWVGLMSGGCDKNHRKAREFMILARVFLQCWTMKSKLDKERSEEDRGVGVYNNFKIAIN